MQTMSNADAIALAKKVLRQANELAELRTRLAEAERLLRVVMGSPRPPYDEIAQFLDPWPEVVCSPLADRDRAADSAPASRILTVDEKGTLRVYSERDAPDEINCPRCRQFLAPDGACQNGCDKETQPCGCSPCGRWPHCSCALMEPDVYEAMRRHYLLLP
jgi:hypothetical protein